MTRPMRCLVGAIAAGVLLTTALAAVAETFTLSLKRRETKSAGYDATSYMYWASRPQYFHMMMTADAKGQWKLANTGQPSQAEAFQRIVTKEPKYQSQHPYRGVLKLGSQEFAFALDTVAPKDKKPDAKGTTVKTEAAVVIEEATDEDADEATNKATDKPDKKSSAKKPRAKPAPVKDLCYNRLYFDFNHNGDLSDDKVIERSADAAPLAYSDAMSYVQFEFPRIDVTIDVEGTKLDYSFYLEGYANGSLQEANGKVVSGYCNVSVSVSSAVCREGDITLEGKRHHVVLLDSNSNGRFDDKCTIAENIHMASGQLYPQPGDTLLIDAKVSNTTFDSPYDPTASEYRSYVSEMVLIDGRWYDMKISPAGDTLTLTRSTVPMGSITNRNEAFRALVYGEGKGFLKIRGTKDAPVSLPEGQWKLFSYTITVAPEPAKPAAKAAGKKPADKTAEQGSLLAAFGQLTVAIAGGGSVTPPVGPSVVSATATEKYKPVTVRNGETVEMPFGPPYTPSVTAMYYGRPANATNVQEKQLYLSMSLVGSSGELCTNLTANGARPGKPDFTITDPDGKVVEQGSFEYG